MVTATLIGLTRVEACLAVPIAAEPGPDLTRRAVAFMIFGLLIALGLVAILLVWGSGRVARRYMSRSEYPFSRDSSRTLKEDAWARIPLQVSSQEDQDEGGEVAKDS